MQTDNRQRGDRKTNVFNSVSSIGLCVSTYVAVRFRDFGREKRRQKLLVDDVTYVTLDGGFRSVVSPRNRENKFWPNSRRSIQSRRRQLLNKHATTIPYHELGIFRLTFYVFRVPSRERNRAVLKRNEFPPTLSNGFAADFRDVHGGTYEISCTTVKNPSVSGPLGEERLAYMNIYSAT